MESLSHSKNPFEDLKSLLKQTNDAMVLEELGKRILEEQAIALLDLFEIKDGLLKLTNILVGLHHKEFIIFLMKLSDLQLNALKAIAETKSMQHHLTLLSHDLQDKIANQSSDISKQTQEIELLEIESIEKQQLILIEKNIANTEKTVLELKKLNKRALVVVWSTSRQDLIESFSRNNEVLENTLTRKTKNLHALLDKQLFSVYDSGEAFEKMKDEEPAVEALARFSIWHQKDYQDIGIAFLRTEETQTTKPAEDGLKAEVSYLKQVEEDLKSIGLKTILDLKKARIYSKTSLRDYIMEQTKKPNT